MYFAKGTNLLEVIFVEKRRAKEGEILVYGRQYNAIILYDGFRNWLNDVTRNIPKPSFVSIAVIENLAKPRPREQLPALTPVIQPLIFRYEWIEPGPSCPTR